MTDPTSQDIANAEARAAIADRFRADYLEALALAESILGPGWEPTGRNMLVDKDEENAKRGTGQRMTPSATVYTAMKDGRRRHFTTEREVASVEEGFGAMLIEPHPTLLIEVRGQKVAPHRYSLYWSGFEPDYRPKTAEQLADAREKREAKAVEKEAAAAPLFAEQIRAEGYMKPRRKR